VKVRIHLREVHFDDSAIRLELDNNSAVHDEVQPMFSNHDGGIPDLDQLLLLNLKVPALQFCYERPGINAFDEPGS